MRHAEIIAIGSEFLLGGRLDTNSLFLTEQLTALGIEVRFKSIVGDHVQDIERVIDCAIRRVDVIVLTGGLGPTRDDVTREAVARAAGVALRRHPVALSEMRKRLAAWGRTPTTAQLRQAWIPAGSQVLSNPIGSAPGFAMRWKKVLLVALPGVPAEAEQMFAASALPWLRSRAATTGHSGQIERRILHTFGLPEASVEERLEPIMPSYRDVRLGLLASPRGVAVSFVKVASTDKKQLDQLIRAARRALGKHVYAEGTDTMEQVVGRALTKRGWTVAVAESCTGGLIGHRLTEVPGSSAYVDRVAVCYSNQAKVDLLGVPEGLIMRHGAVSSEVAAAMANGIRRRSGAQIGLSVTGIAGPGGGTPEKPVGLVYIGLDCIAGKRTTKKETGVTHEFRFHGPREAIKLRASQAALNTLRQWLDVKV